MNAAAVTKPERPVCDGIDYHIHTFFSPCASPVMSLYCILEAAEAAGLREVGLSDHPHRPGLAGHHRALAAARETCTGQVKLWIGAELETTAMGRLAIPRKDLPFADYILAAASHYDIIRDPPVPDLLDPVAWANRLLSDLENVAGSGADSIAHPFYSFALLRPTPGYPVAPMDDIVAEFRPARVDHWLESMAAEHIALEISPRLCAHLGLESYIEDTYRKARQLGIRFSIGSDSHRPDTIGRIGQAEGLVRRLELTAADLWSPADRIGGGTGKG